MHGVKCSDDRAWQWEGSPWKTRSAYFSYIRGGIRRGLWNRHPCKIQFLNNNRFKIPNPNPKNAKRFPTVWGATCNVCKGTFTLKEMEVDHLKGNHSLQEFKDISTFIESIVTVTPDDLQLVCKDCHKIKSYADKHGVSFEEAVAIKKAIEICKAKKDKEFLLKRGIEPESNATKRRKQVEEVLLNEANS